jgi:hypothetical protein
MADQGWAVVVRIATAMLAIALVIATVFAVVSPAVARVNQEGATGTLIGNVLSAPFIFVFYVGPALAAMGMASRSRGPMPAFVALFLALANAALLEYLGATPWHSRNGETEMNLVLGTLVGLWPVTVGAWTLWMVLNRWTPPRES